MYIVVLKQLSVMALIAIVGFVVTKAFKFEKKEEQFLSKLLLYVINPCLIVCSFDKPYSPEKMHDLLLMILLSFVAHLVLSLLAILFCRSKSEQGKQLDCLDKLSVVFTNCGFIGIPLINGVFGAEGTFYLMGFLAIFNIWLWTFGYYMIAGTVKPLKVITNPSVIAVLIGLLLFCLPINLPQLISKPLSLIGDMNTAVSMLLLGMLFATFKKPQTSLKEYVLRVTKVTLLRLVVSAFAMLFVAWGAVQVFSSFENIRLITYVVFIAALCPVGMSVSSFAVLFNKDESYASMIVVVTSALCIVTLPLSIALAERFF